MKKILIIEDEEDLLEEIACLLEYEGFDVLQSSDGENGIIMAKQELPDLILCDILLPGKNGYEVITQLKESYITTLIPFIFISAFDGHEKRRQCIELGADDFLLKPFSRIELIDTIKKKLLHDSILKKKRKPEKELPGHCLSILKIHLILSLGLVN